MLMTCDIVFIYLQWTYMFATKDINIVVWNFGYFARCMHREMFDNYIMKNFNLYVRRFDDRGRYKWEKIDYGCWIARDNTMWPFNSFSNCTHDNWSVFREIRSRRREKESNVIHFAEKWNTFFITYFIIFII